VCRAETAVEQRKRQAGWQVYATNDLAPALPQVVWAYRGQYRVGDDWSRLKGRPPGPTPMYLTDEQRMIDWLLRHGREGPAARLLNWGLRKELERIDRDLVKKVNPVASGLRERSWYVNGQGQTFAVIPGPVTFRMGSPLTEADRFPWSEKPHVRVIPRS
jgi:hypothetical protein